MSYSTSLVRGLVGAVSILVIGFVIGVATDRVVFVHGGSGGHAGEIRIGSAAKHHAVLAELNERLRLTPEQDARVREIVEASQFAVDTAWSAVREHLERATGRMIAQMEAELDEDQRELLRVWVVERHGELPAVDSIHD
jgi:hypothetical protein